ncbi:MAG: Maf family protein [Bacteriovoracaceae bacterium]|nr:Maf family protein [Bacteriovoracaceae bacterium]
MGKNKSLTLPYPLILASTSKYRGELLGQLGWPFRAVAPGVDEDKIKDQGHTPGELALLLSRFKAEAVFAKNPDACVIGSDQVCSMGEMIFGKPHTAEGAREQLSLMQGKKHQLLTAVTVISPLGIKSFLNTTTLHMRPLTLPEIHSYVSQDNPLDCAGSYKLEGRGIKLFEEIEMKDHTAIIGLPLIELTSLLLKWGYPL